MIFTVKVSVVAVKLLLFEAIIASGAALSLRLRFILLIWFSKVIVYSLLQIPIRPMLGVNLCVCVCVCVSMCDKERERKQKRRETHARARAHTHTHTLDVFLLFLFLQC